MSNNEHLAPTPFDIEAYNEFKRAVASRESRPSIPNDAAIETPEEIAERGRAMFRRALMQADADDLQEDLRQMLETLGMSAHARPYSPHRVFQEALAEMKRQLVAPNAREKALDQNNRDLLDRMIGFSHALEKIACRHVTNSPLWWQEEARAALEGRKPWDWKKTDAPTHAGIGDQGRTGQ